MKHLLIGLLLLILSVQLTNVTWRWQTIGKSTSTWFQIQKLLCLTFLYKNMSQIKLKKESMKASFQITPDIDENNVPFNRLTFTVKHPISKEVIYYELNKNDSKTYLQKKKMACMEKKKM